MSTAKLVKVPYAPEGDLGSVKSRSQTFQVFDDLSSFLRILKSTHKTGVIRINVYMGGVGGIEFEEIEKFKVGS